MPHKNTPPFPSKDKFIQFVKEIAPDANVVSVMLFGQLHRVSHQLTQIAEKRLEATGLTLPQFRLLMNLMHCERHSHSDGMMPSELSERQNITRNTISALISSLEANGYISRELHGTDRRKFLIRLTPKGRKILQAQMATHFEYLGQCFDTLGVKERQTLHDLLNRLNDGLSSKVKTD